MDSPVSNETLSQLAKIDTPTICNVIELFKIRPNNVEYTDKTIVARFPNLPPMVGFATTACYSSKKDYGSAYSMLVEQVDAIGTIPSPRVVVIEDLDQPPMAASFGDLTSTMFKVADANGLVSSGVGRDFEQIEPLKFPVYSTGTIVSHGYYRVFDFNVPVTIGGLKIQPGDLLHGDGDGITKIPLEIVDEIPQLCSEYTAIEQEMANMMKRPNGGISAIRDAFESSKTRFKELAETVGKIRA